MFQFVVTGSGFVLGRITETGLTPASLHTYHRRGHERMGKGNIENKAEWQPMYKDAMVQPVALQANPKKDGQQTATLYRL